MLLSVLSLLGSILAPILLQFLKGLEQETAVDTQAAEAQAVLNAPRSKEALVAQLNKGEF